MKKLFIKTYGCQMNAYDSARMADLLAPLGYAATDTVEGADMIVLNPCHIREKAAEKVYSELGRVARLVGLQFFEETADGLVVPPVIADGRPEHAHAFAHWLLALLRGQGEDVELDAAGAPIALTLSYWKLGAGLGLADARAAALAPA